MRVASLFTGIGGLELGLRQAGHETVASCEIWQPARAVLADRFPNVECWSDVATLPSLPAEADVLTGGFPCQDLSQAGLTAGIGGSRSGLVGHVFRLLDQRPVPWVVLENVSFMLHLDQGKALSTLVAAFEERGYRWAYRVVSSLAFLPQRRERVLFVATNTDSNPADVLHADDVSMPRSRTDLTTHAHGFYWTEGVRGLGWAEDAIPTLKNGSTIGIPSPPAILLPDGTIITPDIRDAERLQGFPADWTRPAVATSPGSARWSLAGNAVTVPVAAWLGRRLAELGMFDSARDRSILRNGRWPKAARFDGYQRFAVEIGMFPIWQERLPLARFLHYPGKPLSARATLGFLKRTERSTLRFPAGFQDRLRAHLSNMIQGSDAPARSAVAAE
jgi:DNA (cytosine-5)-methyltransferase 1